MCARDERVLRVLNGVCGVAFCTPRVERCCMPWSKPLPVMRPSLPAASGYNERPMKWGVGGDGIWNSDVIWRPRRQLSTRVS